MQLRITQQRRRVEGTSHDRVFDWVGQRNWGFSFRCNADGVIETPENEAARDNLAKCLSGEHKVVDRGIRTCHNAYTLPAEGRCECGAVVVLDGDTRGEGIDCTCGRVYNSGGDELRPRNQWEENQGDDY